MRIKYKLTKSEQQIQFDNVARLMAAGITVGLEEAVLSEWPALRVDQSERCTMVAHPIKGIEAAICLRLTPTKSGVILRDYFEITVPGCNDLNFLLSRPKGGIYKALGHFEFARGEVLNGHFLTGRPLSPNQVLCSIVLAYSFEPLPTWFQRGMTVEATVSLMDQLDNVYRSTIDLNIERHVPRQTRHATGSNSLRAPSRQQPSSSGAGIIGGGDTEKGEDVVDS